MAASQCPSAANIPFPSGDSLSGKTCSVTFFFFFKLLTEFLYCSSPVLEILRVEKSLGILVKNTFYLIPKEFLRPLTEHGCNKAEILWQWLKRGGFKMNWE